MPPKSHSKIIYKIVFNYHLNETNLNIFFYQLRIIINFWKSIYAFFDNLCTKIMRIDYGMRQIWKDYYQSPINNTRGTKKGKRRWKIMKSFKKISRRFLKIDNNWVIEGSFLCSNKFSTLKLMPTKELETLKIHWNWTVIYSLLFPSLLLTIVVEEVFRSMEMRSLMKK